MKSFVLFSICCWSSCFASTPDDIIDVDGNGRKTFLDIVRKAASVVKTPQDEESAEKVAYQKSTQPTQLKVSARAFYPSFSPKDDGEFITCVQNRISNNQTSWIEFYLLYFSNRLIHLDIQLYAQCMEKVSGIAILNGFENMDENGRKALSGNESALKAFEARTQRTIGEDLELWHLEFERR